MPLSDLTAETRYGINWKRALNFSRQSKAVFAIAEPGNFSSHTTTSRVAKSDTRDTFADLPNEAVLLRAVFESLSNMATSLDSDEIRLSGNLRSHVTSGGAAMSGTKDIFTHLPDDTVLAHPDFEPPSNLATTLNSDDILPFDSEEGSDSDSDSEDEDEDEDDDDSPLASTASMLSKRLQANLEQTTAQNVAFKEGRASFSVSVSFRKYMQVWCDRHMQCLVRTYGEGHEKWFAKI